MLISFCLTKDKQISVTCLPVVISLFVYTLHDSASCCVCGVPNVCCQQTALWYTNYATSALKMWLKPMSRSLQYILTFHSFLVLYYDTDRNG